MTTAQPVIAQLDNSTNIEENEEPFSSSYDLVNVIYLLLFVVAFFSISIAALKKKERIRKVIALIILFVSVGTFIPSATFRQSNETNEDYRAFGILLVIIALIIAFIPKRKITKETIPWQKRNGIRRNFPIQVQDQVLKGQKYKCANCGMSISGALIQYDHIDGDRSNNDISNCVALCPNCHSLKTDDDRRDR